MAEEQTAAVVENGSTPVNGEDTTIEFVPTSKNLREDMNLIREMKSLHVFFSTVEELQDKLINSSLMQCAACTIKIQVNDIKQKDGWVHFHFDNVIQALQMESELKNTFPDGKVHTGEFSPNKDEEGEKSASPTPNDGSRPMERTLCLYNVPLTVTEAQIQSAVSDDVRITMAVDEENQFKGYVYLHYKLAEDANKAYSTYKKDPVQIGETTIKITKLTPDDKTKDKKRNQTSKKGAGVCPERQALSASLDALRKQHQAATQPMDRQKLKQKIATLKNMMSSYDRNQGGRNKQARFSPSMHPGMGGYGWPSGPMGGRPYSAGMYPMSRHEPMHMGYDYHMGSQQGMMSAKSGGRGGRMSNRGGYNNGPTPNKSSYVSRGKAGYAVLNSKQQKQQKKPEPRNQYNSRQDNHDMSSMMETFQQMSMQQQQPTYNNTHSAYNFKDNYNSGYANDYKNNGYTNGYHQNTNGYTEESSAYWNGNAMTNGTANLVQNQRKPMQQQTQQNNWGMAQQQRQTRNGMPIANANYGQSYM